MIVGFVLSFGLGALWYSSLLFGKKWAEGVGITLKSEHLLTIVLVALMVICIMLTNGYFAQKSAYARHTEIGFIAAMTVVMIICQGVF